MPPSVIAERLIVRRPTRTGILRTLEERALVRRAPHPTDGRMALIALSEAGWALVEALRPILHQHQRERELMACLAPAEQEALLGILGRPQARLRTLAESRPAS